MTIHKKTPLLDRRVYKNLNSSSIISRYVRDLKKAKALEEEQLYELEAVLLLVQKRSADEVFRSIQMSKDHYSKSHEHIEQSFFYPHTD